MKVEQLLTEHKKGVKAVKYSKKPQPLVGPEAQKKKAKVKTAPPKTELEKHSKLATKLEGVTEGDSGAKYKVRSIGHDAKGDYYISPSTGKKVYKKGVKVGDHENPKTGEHKSVAEGKIKINIKKQPETAQEKLYKKHQELRKKSGLPDPSEYKKKAAEKQKEIDDMKEAKQPEAPKPRNFVAKNAKTVGAGKHKDAKKAAKEVRGQKHKNKEMAEAAMGKVVDYKPGVSATIDTGPGMTTMLDLKKNPTSLTKDPSTGKLKLMPGTAATAQPSATTQSTVKPGDQVEMPKTNTMAAEDILRLAGLR